MSSIAAIQTLAVRRASLTARTPRQILVPLLTPILFAVVIAPALKSALGGFKGGLDYTAFVSVGTVGLLVPLTAIFAGLSVIVDRQSGAQRDLLAAPVRRALLVLGNLPVAVAVSVLQLAVLVVVADARGAKFDTSPARVLWFVAGALLLTVFMYGVAETLAARIPRQEEYIAATPAVAVLPWFFAGALFPIGALPAVMTSFAKVLPLTHALALLRYGLVDPQGKGLHDIWGSGNTAVLAALSLGVLVAFAVGFTLLAIRLFTRSVVD